MRPLSILFVTSRFPLPLLSGDRARAFQQMRILSRTHRITLVTYEDATATPQARQRLEELGVRIVTVPFSRAAAVLRLGRGLWSRLPLQAVLYDAPAMRAAIRTAVSETRFDLIHVQLARTMPLVGEDLGLPRVADLIDALSLNMRRRAERDRTPLRWVAQLDATRLARYERDIAAATAAAFVVAPADRDAIGPGVTVIPNGVDLSAFPRVTAARDPHALVFTGNLGYFPNVDAVGWFVERVLPLVWREEPAARLTVAGARPHRRLLHYAQRDPRIIVAGDVERMHPFLAQARVAVAPMRAGSGQLLKVLEAMATGTPVVTTTRGLSGIEATADRDLLVADTPEAFAAHIVSLIRDDDLAERVSSAGHALVERLYTWERSVADLERAYLRVVQDTPGPAAATAPPMASHA